MTDVSIVLVSYNTADLLAECLKCIRRSTSSFKREVIVVDNGSRDHSADLIRKQYPECRLIENSANLGFARAANQALRWATGRYILLVNSDAFVGPDSIEKTLAYMDAHPHCGILGAKLVAPDGALHPSARYFPTVWNLFLQRTGLHRFFKGVRMVDDLGWDHASVRSCDWVPGCYYLVRKAVIDKVGFFDPRYFLYYEEVDQCLAARKAGWDVVFYPDTTVVHIGGQSAKAEGVGVIIGRGPELEALQIESELLYFRKNHGVVGVWAHFLLTTAADAIFVAKCLLRRKSSHHVGSYAKHTALVWSLFKRTAWGTRPTR